MEPTSDRFPQRPAWEPAGAPCLNCERELIGPYCHHCGQKEQDLDIRFSALASDWLGGVAGFDARIWSTLRVLFRRPGQLTLEFLEGRRARYVSPLRLYLVASLLMLVSLKVFDGGIINSSGSGGGIVQIRGGEEAPEEVREAFKSLEDLGASGASDDESAETGPGTPSDQEEVPTVVGPGESAGGVPGEASAAPQAPDDPGALTDAGDEEEKHLRQLVAEGAIERFLILGGFLDAADAFAD
ncbi:MAG: DUF3667 domain-containing protein, partial [Acidobacteriota bacterium]